MKRLLVCSGPSLSNVSVRCVLLLGSLPNIQIITGPFKFYPTCPIISKPANSSPTSQPSKGWKYSMEIKVNLYILAGKLPNNNIY